MAQGLPAAAYCASLVAYLGSGGSPLSVPCVMCSGPGCKKIDPIGLSSFGRFLSWHGPLRSWTAADTGVMIHFPDGAEANVGYFGSRPASVFDRYAIGI